MRTLKQIEKALKKEYPNGPDMVYINYNDQLSPEQIEQIIQEGRESIEDNFFDWINESSNQYIDEIVMPSINVTEEENETDYIYDFIVEWCYNNDASTPLEDILRNSSYLLYYDCNFSLSELSNDEINEDIKHGVKAVKDILGIKRLSKANREAIELMIEQAFYGGDITLLLTTDKYSMTTLLDIQTSNTLTVENPVVCIMDRAGGSGDFTTLEGVTVTIPFNYKNLHSDIGNNGYSIQDVFGTIGDIGATKWQIQEREGKKQALVNNEEQARINKEKQYEETYKNGGCTFGDMNIKRHQDTPYINDFPCGNKCTKCGTFWID